jgi:hypothetical protein
MTSTYCVCLLAAVSRSLTPEDVLTNTGLSKGSIAQFLAPLVAGLVCAIEESGVKQQMQDFATKKAVKAVTSQEDNLTKQGKRCRVLDGIFANL